MYHSRKKVVENIEYEMSTVWCCSNDSCKVWMRDNFAFSVVPLCIQCKSPMIKKAKEIGILENNSPIPIVKE